VVSVPCTTRTPGPRLGWQQSDLCRSGLLCRSEQIRASLEAGPFAVSHAWLADRIQN